MFIARNKDGELISIDEASVNGEYFCPVCGQKVMQKRGAIKLHHFAHMKDNACCDNWNYDMSFWHYNWQCQFPKETREVVLKHGDEMHRADVLLKNIKTVIEFQHSPMSFEEFDERNKFYTSLGYKVIWLFDVCELVDNFQICENDKQTAFKWKYAKSTFRNLDLKSKNIELYFQFHNAPMQDKQYAEFTNKEKSGITLDYLEERYLETFEDDSSWIDKVIWEYSDYKYFGIEKLYLSFFDFIELFIPRIEKLNINNLYDRIIKFSIRNDEYLGYGCPKTNNHICLVSTYWESNGEYNECQDCPYGKYDGETYRCTKRIHDLNINSSAEIINVERNKLDFINKITIVENGETKEVKLEEINPDFGNDIFYWWDKAKPNKKMELYNLKNDTSIILFDDPLTKYRKYHRVYGLVKKGNGNYSSKTMEIYNIFNKDWIPIYLS